MNATTRPTNKTGSLTHTADSSDNKKSNPNIKDFVATFGNSLAEVLKGMNELSTMISVVKVEQGTTAEKVNSLFDALSTQTADVPFVEEVKFEIEETETRQKKLEQDIDQTMSEFDNLNKKYEELKKTASNLKYKEIRNNSGKQEIIYPKELFQEQLKEYTKSLNFALEMPKNLQKRVKGELKSLNPFEQTLSTSQTNYRDRITQKINQIHLLSNKLSIARQTYMEPAVVILPELRDLHTDISNLFDEIDKQKDEYQAMTMTSADWDTVQVYLKSSQKQFGELIKKATEYETIAKDLHSKATPKKIDTTTNSRKLFFAHTEKIKEENDKAWNLMIADTNTEIDRLRSSLYTQWNSIHNKFVETGVQIDHIGYAEKEKAFPAKMALTSSLALWSKRTVGTYAEIKTTPIV